MFHVRRALIKKARERRREARRRRLEAAELKEAERTPSRLLFDEGLRLSTELVQLPDLDQRGRLRHDYCVLLRQVAAFDTTGCVEKSITIGKAHEEPDTPRDPDSPALVNGTDPTPSAGAATENTQERMSTWSDLKAKMEGGENWIKRKVNVNLPRSTWQLHVRHTRGNLDGHALFILGEAHPVRKFCLWFIKLPWFESVILAIIALNCVMMAVDQADSSTTFRRAFAVCQEIFLYIFVLEIILKVIAMGLVCGPNTYLRDHWNKLDVLIVSADIFVLILNQFQPCEVQGLLVCSEIQGNVANLSVLRTIRVLRPFRSINRFNHMKFLVQRLLQSIPELVDSVVLLGFVLMLFSIVSVQLYSGAFLQRCIDPLTGRLQSEVQGNPSSNLCRLDSALGDTWGSCEQGFVCQMGVGHNPNLGITSFDNLASAGLAIFQAVTLEGWAPLMYDVRQAKGIQNDIFFIVLVVFGALFMMNLVVAVLVSNFDGVEDDAAFTKRRKSSSSRLMSEPSGETKVHCLRRHCVTISESKIFTTVILVLILLNTVALGLDNVVEDGILDKVNIFFTCVFTIEMVVKLIGHGPQFYCTDPYNQFDAVVVFISLVDIVITWIGADLSGHFIIIRSFRLMRIFKLSRRMRSLARVLNALWDSLAHIRDLGALMLLFMFVSALMGVSFFSGKANDDEENAKWSYISSGAYQGQLERPNFSTFAHALITTFIMVTGENWNDVMYIGVHQHGWPCVFFFLIIVIIGNYIILNLFLAILVDSFEKDDGPLEEESSEAVTQSPVPSERGSTRVLRRPTLRKRKSQQSLMSGKSLHFLGKDNPIRVFVFRVVSHPHFDSLTYLLISVSSVILALDSPDERDPDRQHVYRVMDCVLTGFFILEAFLKILAFGFICGPDSYLMDPWNMLDFCVVLISVANLAMREAGTGSELAWVKALRALRALRPLRMVSRNEGLKAVVMSIAAAVPAIAEVLLVLVLFLTIFSILGVQFFKNKFNQCSCMEWCPLRRFDPLSGLAAEKRSEELCQGECMDAPLHARACNWEPNPHYSFDNTLYAILTLFEVSTLEMWPEVMWLSVDGVGKDEAPAYNHSPLAAIFFIVFISVMTFFILNLFVGVVIDKFTMVRNELNGLLILTERQQKWVKTQKKLLKVQPRPLLTPPEDIWRQLALQLISLSQFDVLMAGLILANVAVMCIGYYGAPRSIERIQENANIVFLGFFTLEAVLKLFALRLRLYFRDLWNVFDFFVVLISLATSSPTLAEFVSIDTTIFRTVRVVRMLRLLKSFTSLRKLFETLVLSLPSLLNIGLMLLLLFYVYTIAGMALFGDIEVNNNPYQLYLNKDVNFQSFYLTMVTMLRMSTGESWNGIMHDCFTGALCANKPDDFSCGSTPIAIVFFCSFMLIGSFVFLNLFIAVLIQNLFESTEMPEASETIRVTDVDLEKFVEAWSRLAPDGSAYIETRKLKRLLKEVDAPLGFSNEVLVGHLMLRVIDRLGIRDYDGMVHFAETLWCLASSVDGADMSGEVADFEVQRNLNRMITRTLPVPSREKARQGMMLYKASEVMAALELQSRWKARKAQQAFHEILMQEGHSGHDKTSIAHKGAMIIAAMTGQRASALNPSLARHASIGGFFSGDNSMLWNVDDPDSTAEGRGVPQPPGQLEVRLTNLQIDDPRVPGNFAPLSLGCLEPRTGNPICGSVEIVPSLDDPDNGNCPQCFNACAFEALNGESTTALATVKVVNRSPRMQDVPGVQQLPAHVDFGHVAGEPISRIASRQISRTSSHEPASRITSRELCEFPPSEASRQRLTYQV